MTGMMSGVGEPDDPMLRVRRKVWMSSWWQLVERDVGCGIEKLSPVEAWHAGWPPTASETPAARPEAGALGVGEASRVADPAPAPVTS